MKDPRAITVWHGNGPPSAAWLAFQEERRATGQRVPPYRQCLGVPLGLKLAPAFACALSGEMVSGKRQSGEMRTVITVDWRHSALRMVALPPSYHAERGVPPVDR